MYHIDSRTIDNSNDVVSNARIYDLDESLVASGYPMRTETQDLYGCEFDEKDLTRGHRLSELATKLSNPAHEQFLSGITVAFDLTLSCKAWIEAERYRYLVFVSSESTMHRIAKFDIASQCNEYVDERIIDILREKIDRYNNSESGSSKDELYLDVLYNIPSGFRLTARMTTNYRCLKNIYRQRKTHRLPEWRKFCDWIETLPYAKELLLTEDDE